MDGIKNTSQSGTPTARRGDECVPQGVRADGLGDPDIAGYPADDPPGAVPVQPTPVGGEEDGSFAAFADRQVDRPRGAGASGMVTTLPP